MDDRTRAPSPRRQAAVGRGMEPGVSRCVAVEVGDDPKGTVSNGSRREGRTAFRLEGHVHYRFGFELDFGHGGLFELCVEVGVQLAAAQVAVATLP